MFGRITTQMTASMTLNDLQQSLNRLDTTQQQLSSGKKLNQPSDDPQCNVPPGMTRFEVESKSANGSRLVLGMTVSPLHEQGEQDGLVGVFKDLTQIRDMEEEMRRKEWLANLGEMSAGMAHEIRNPLGALAGAMQMLRPRFRRCRCRARCVTGACSGSSRSGSASISFLASGRLRSAPKARASPGRRISAGFSPA